MDQVADLFESPTFLSWLPGETLFSLVSRHYYFRGHGLAAHTCEQFFGHHRAGSQHDLPSRLSQFVRRTGGCFGNVEEIAQHHTLLSYYAAFLPPDELTNAIVSMSGDSVAHLKFRLGILASRFRANHPLKACEACIKEDRTAFGWAYWHMEHQFPGVWICQTHGELLRESTLKATGVERFEWHLPAEENFRDWTAELRGAMQREQAALQGLSELVSELVSTLPVGSIDTSRLHEVYRVELARRAWVTAGGSLRMTAIAASYLDHVKRLRVLPELEALPATLEEAAIQLGRMLRPPRSGTHPLRHLVLINWLFGSAEAFRQCYLSVVTSITTLSPGTVLHEDQSAKEVTDPRREKLVGLLSSQKQSMRKAAQSLGVDVGTAMAWAAKAGLPVPRRPKKLTDHLRRQAITDLQSGADKAVVAANAGVSVVTITKLLLSEVGLHAAWCQARETKARASARQGWEELLQMHKGLGVKFIRALNPSAYIWLYRNDRAWLDAHKPDRQPETMALGGARVMWDARDEALSEVVRRAVLELRERPGTAQIKLWQIYQAVPELKAKLAALNRLPLTRHVIDLALRRRNSGPTEPDLFA